MRKVRVCAQQRTLRFGTFGFRGHLGANCQVLREPFMMRIRRAGVHDRVRRWAVDSALALARDFFDMAFEAYLVKDSCCQKPYRRISTENFGATVFLSPANNTHYRRDILAEDPDSPDSLGMARSGGAKKYSLGSALNHVLMHQTFIGIESFHLCAQFEHDGH